MYAPDKIAWLIFKMMMYITIFSLLLGVGNVVPYYMRMHETANDLILRASVNNYLTKNQVNNIVETSFGEGLYSSLTYTGDNDGVAADSMYADSIYVYARTAPFEMDLFESANCEIGEGCPAYENNKVAGKTTKVIFDPTDKWDPKTDPDDMITFIKAGGAQRGDTIGIRMDAKVKVKVFVVGGIIEFGIPLAVEKYGPAMHYYRGR